MSEAMAIVSVGVCSPVGLDAAQTEVALRAGIARKLESSILDARGEPVRVGHLRERHLPALRESAWMRSLSALEQRLVQLGGRALAEALAPLSPEARPALALAGPPAAERGVPVSGADDRDGALLAALTAQAEVCLGPSELCPGGGASWFSALERARASLHDPRGDGLAVAGGLDSFVDPARLAALEAAERLLTAGPQDAHTPGEAAAFLVLATAPACRRFQLTPLAWIAALRQELRAPGDRGALARACAAVLDGQGADAAPARTVMAGLDGESSSAREWGIAALRNQDRLDPTHALHHSAEFIGDAGAALAPLMTAVAALRLRAGQSRGPALVWGGTGEGPRGALLMYA